MFFAQQSFLTVYITIKETNYNTLLCPQGVAGGLFLEKRGDCVTRNLGHRILPRWDRWPTPVQSENPSQGKMSPHRPPPTCISRYPESRVCLTILIFFLLFLCFYLVDFKIVHVCIERTETAGQYKRKKHHCQNWSMTSCLTAKSDATITGSGYHPS